MKALFFALLGLAGLTVSGQTSPTLFVERTAPQNLRIIWTNTGTGFALEQSGSLGAGALWQPPPTQRTEQNNQFSILINASDSAQFFRLRALGLTRIADSSPLNGETGVAVTRETIVRFTAPLLKSTLLTETNFYAGFGGRRLLTRIELSSDRTRASMFYLEPMPGSTRVTVVFDGTGLRDESGRPLDVDADGVAGGFATINFDTLNLNALNGTAVVGRVFASELMPGSGTGTNPVNRPLEGVTITVDGREQELRAVTDAQGNFTLSPAPPGRFFVKIDGRTAKGSDWPKGAYYPYVGKAWEAVAGKTNNLAGGTGEIFLPLITAGTLQPVSSTTDTTISFPPAVIAANPALKGVFITVPANSLFNDDGTRGGKVGIAPVPPDRLPGPLPPGADLPLVITVQTDGALNFDTPAPVCFPNLPNAITGKPWPPGTPGSLISFNHKKGVWEDVGGMTVSADGKFFCTDPGVGILQPGWHGPQCPPPAKPKPKPDPNCKPDPRALENCIAEREDEAVRCREIAAINFEAQKRLCSLFEPSRGADFVTDCISKARTIWTGRLDACALALAEGEKLCNECNGTPRPQSFGGGSGPSSRIGQVALQGINPALVEDQISALLAQIGQLLTPYQDSSAHIPSAVAQQVYDLFAQADSIAGGDALQFLTDRVIQFERSHATLDDDLTIDRGNAPSYPILYAAHILRPNESLVWRGKTEPFGQYLIFVPPDGRLLSVDFYDPNTKRYGTVYPYLRTGAPYALPRITLVSLPADAADSDHDGLPDVVEFVYGTDPNNPDTNADGIPDGAAVDMGLDPLAGLIARTGIVATAQTPGTAVDVAVGSELVVTAEGGAGISIFNAYTGDNPTVIAHVPTPGNARRVAVSGNWIAVAQPDFGLSILDVSTPPSASIVQQFPLIGAQAVVIGGGTAYVGGGGVIVAMDLSTGLLNSIRLPDAVRDLALDGDYLYAVTDGQLLAFSVANGTLSAAGSVPSPFFAKPNERLFVGGGIAYATHTGGYNTFDLATPSAPVLIKAGVTTLYGWKQLISNGSGLGLAALGPNSAFDFAQDISLYDLSSPTNVNVPITIFPTPGHAQSVAIWKGLGYVADLEAGLQVINYLPYDNKGVAPQIALAPGFDMNGVAAGDHIVLKALATDDVQVRAVEFYLDGEKVLTDGNFPFEYRFVAPPLTLTKTSFTLRARAMDTGGNATWSETITTKLLPEFAAGAPPVVNFTTPVGGGRSVTNLQAYFSKPLDPATLNSSSFQLFSAGQDGILGTPDDALVSGGSVSYRSFGHAAVLTFAAPLPLGRYRAVIGTPVTDLAGNHLATRYAWDLQVTDATFWVNFGDGRWDVPFNWDTGMVPAASNNVVINFPVTVTLPNTLRLGQTVSGAPGARLYVPYGASITFDALTLNTDLKLDPSVGLSVVNGLTLNGQVTLPGGQNYTQLIFDGTQTVDGSGTIILVDFPYSPRLIPVSGTLTIGADLKIHGSGVVGDPARPLINLGTITADSSAPGQSLTVTGSTMENRGSLRAQNGALLILENGQNHGVIDIPGGALNLTGTSRSDQLGTITGAGGVVSVLGTLDNRNRTLKLDPSGPSWQIAGGKLLGGNIAAENSVTFTAIAGTLDGITFDANLHLVSGAHLTALNGFTLNRVLTMEPGGNYTFIGFDGTQTFDGSGEVILENGTTKVQALSGTLTIGSKLTIRGSGTVGYEGLPLVNLGTILADTGGPGKSISFYGSTVENGGTLESRNGGALAIENLRNHGLIDMPNGSLDLTGDLRGAELGTISATGGTVTLGGTLDNRGNILSLDPTNGFWRLTGTILGGTIQGSAGAVLNVPGSQASLDGVTLDIDLTLPGRDGGLSLRITNGLTLNKTATLTGGFGFTAMNFEGTQSFDGTGQVVFSGGPNSELQPLNGSLTIGAGLTVRGGSGIIGNNIDPLTIQATVIADGLSAVIHLLGNPFTDLSSKRELNGGRIIVPP